MSAQEQAAALEQAIFDRARSLAEEHKQQAERIAEQIRRDAQEKRSHFEAVAVSRATSRAEREYRRLLQAAEIRLQAQLDRMRWGLVDSVLRIVDERLQRIRADREEYAALVRRLLSEASKEIPGERLTVRVRKEDYGQLESQWQAIATVAAPDKVLTLSDQPFACSGGVLVESEDGRIRMNNTFEGRLERLRPDLQRTIVKTLFPQDSEPEALFHG